MIADAPRHILGRALRRRIEGDHATRNWLVAWLGGPIIGITNGVIRELGYTDSVGELTAHQISTATAIALFALYFAILTNKWPLPSTRRALEIGAVWVALTVAFEFLFGHYGDGKSWSELLRDYNVADGHLWPLVLVWLGTGPALLHRAFRAGRR